MKQKPRASTAALLAVFAVGICLLLYPTASDWWNGMHQTRAIESYAEQVEKLDDGERERMLEEARAYNRDLLSQTDRWHPTDTFHARYESVLAGASDVMCYVEVPAARIKLPVYHGMDDAVLQVAAGHIEGTSLPVGGASTHAVLSGHRGLPSARLFSDIDQLVEGDTFLVHVLGETLAYEVDQIRIVEPDDVSELGIEDGRDLCTLVTCTPYGVNTHRLLVRGHRVPYEPGVSDVTADAVRIDPARVAPIIAAPVLLVLMAIVLWRTRKPKDADERRDIEER